MNKYKQNSNRNKKNNNIKKEENNELKKLLLALERNILAFKFLLDFELYKVHPEDVYKEPFPRNVEKFEEIRNFILKNYDKKLDRDLVPTRLEDTYSELLRFKNIVNEIKTKLENKKNETSKTLLEEIKKLENEVFNTFLTISTVSLYEKTEKRLGYSERLNNIEKSNEEEINKIIKEIKQRTGIKNTGNIWDIVLKRFLKNRIEKIVKEFYNIKQAVFYNPIYLYGNQIINQINNYYGIERKETFDNPFNRKEELTNLLVSKLFGIGLDKNENSILNEIIEAADAKIYGMESIIKNLTFGGPETKEDAELKEKIKNKLNKNEVDKEVEDEFKIHKLNKLKEKLIELQKGTVELNKNNQKFIFNYKITLRNLENLLKEQVKLNSNFPKNKEIIFNIKKLEEEKRLLKSYIKELLFKLKNPDNIINNEKELEEISKMLTDLHRRFERIENIINKLSDIERKYIADLSKNLQQKQKTRLKQKNKNKMKIKPYN